MLRNTAFLALGALLLACPSKTKKIEGLSTGAYVRLDGVLGDPLVVVDEVRHGVLFCRTIPGDRKLHVPLARITRAEPVSPETVAKIKAVSRSSQRMLDHLDEANSQINRELQAMVPNASPTSAPPPQAPSFVDHPDNAPHNAAEAVQAVGADGP